MPVHVTCSHCGVAMLRHPSRVRPKAYCSTECRASWHRVRTAPAVLAGDIGMIPLRRRDGEIVGYAVVDATDAEWANQWVWHIDTSGYARRNEAVGVKRQRVVKLHRAIVGLDRDPSVSVDHIDRDRLNNRRSNLRIIPRSGNPQNKSASRRGSSRYRGVYRDKRIAKWAATFTVRGIRTTLGYFDDEAEAGAAVKRARLAHMPFAVD